ncbi:MAG: hypothetical protein HY874_09745 [Chloroflexi bacterium]|nr:hypothetical protein [Chloroflexota bacterium]
MSRQIQIAAIALLAFGALGLGLLGADAAGLGGNVIPTPTSTPTATATPPRLPAPAWRINLSAAPDEIVCDGQHASRVTVQVFGPDGNPVPDGTPVYFATVGRPGFVSPPVATTHFGLAKTDAGAYLNPQAPFEPFSVQIDTSRIEATLRVLCLPPGAGGCDVPSSPPQVSPPDVSPPQQSSPPQPTCVPPQSPPECVPPASPPQNVSPPCRTPTPTPQFSPPPCGVPSPPLGTPDCATSTPTPCGVTSPPFGTPPCGGVDVCLIPIPPFPPLPCDTPTPTPTPGIATDICLPPPFGTLPCDTPTPTPTPAPAGIFWAIDCDLSTAGIESQCEVPLGTGSLDVGVILGNAGALTPHVAAFNFVVHDPDTGRLDPAPGLDLDRNSNPDLDESDMIGPWYCGLPAPNIDTGQDGPGTAASFLSCFNPADVSNLPVLGPGGLRLAKVHYNFPAGAEPGSVLLTLSEAAVADAGGADMGGCPGEGGLPVIPCLPAKINLVPQPATATATATATPAPCTGDVNGDRKVNVIDLVAVTQHLGKRPPDLRFDVNHDGKLNSLDLVLVIKNMGKRC